MPSWGKKKKGNKSAYILCIIHANRNLILKIMSGLENAKSMQVHQLLLSKNGMEEDFK